MPPSKPRQKRKREVETDADNAQCDSGVGERQGSDGAGVTQKRPRLDANVGNDRNIGSVLSGSSIVGRGASINGAPVAARASSSNVVSRQPGGAAINNGHPAVRTSPVVASQPPRSSSQRPDIATAASVEKTASVSQRMRHLAQDSSQNGINLQSDFAAHVTPEKKADDASRDQSVVRKNNIVSHSTTANGGVKSKNNDVVHAYNRERRKLKFILLFSVVYMMGALFTFSSIVYTQNVNHNLNILELEALHSLSSERQSELIEREMQEKEQIRLSLKTANVHLKDSQKTITRLQQELAYTTQTHKEQVLDHESIIQQHDEETHHSLETVQGRLSDCQKKIMLLGQELANTTRAHTMQIEDYKSIIQQQDKELRVCGDNDNSITSEHQKCAVVVEESVATVQAELDTLRQEYTLAKEDLQVASAEKQEVESQLEGLTAQLADLRQRFDQVSKEREDTAGQLNSIILSLEAELTSVPPKNNDTPSNDKQMDEDHPPGIASIEPRSILLLVAMEGLIAIAATVFASKLIIALGIERKARAKATEDLNCQKDQVQQLKKLTSEHERCAMINKESFVSAKEEAEQLKFKIINLEEDLLESDKEMERLAGVIKMVESTHVQTLKQLERERASAISDLVSQKHEMTKRIECLSSEIKYANEESSSLSDALDASKQMVRLEREIHNTRIVSLETKLEDLLSEIGYANEESSSLCDALDASKEMVNLEREIHNTRIVSLEAKLLESKKVEEKLVCAMTSLESTHAETLVQLEEERNAAIDDLESQKQDMTERIESLLSEIECANEESSSLSEALVAVKAMAGQEQERLNAKIAALEADLLESTNEMERLGSALKLLESTQVEALACVKAEKNVAIDELESQKQAMTERIESLLSEIECANEESISLSEALECANEEISSLREELDAAKRMAGQEQEQQNTKIAALEASLSEEIEYVGDIVLTPSIEISKDKHCDDDGTALSSDESASYTKLANYWEHAEHRHEFVVKCDPIQKEAMGKQEKISLENNKDGDLSEEDMDDAGEEEKGEDFGERKAIAPTETNHKPNGFFTSSVNSTDQEEYKEEDDDEDWRNHDYVPTSLKTLLSQQKNQLSEVITSINAIPPSPVEDEELPEVDDVDVELMVSSSSSAMDCPTSIGNEKLATTASPNSEGKVADCDKIFMENASDDENVPLEGHAADHNVENGEVEPLKGTTSPPINGDNVETKGGDVLWLDDILSSPTSMIKKSHIKLTPVLYCHRLESERKDRPRSTAVEEEGVEEVATENTLSMKI